MLCKRLLKAAVLAATLVTAGAAMAQPDPVYPLIKRWAQINYHMQGDAQEKAFAQLAGDADQLATAQSDDARVLTWQGIILASQARAQGGLGALGLAKQARTALERAIELDSRGDDGSAYVTLGTLYARVPGWPVGFGDDEKAERLLEKAVEIRPQGIDTLYFYADYLHEQGRDAAALEYARRAEAAPGRPGRDASDAGLREEIRQLLAELGQGK
ncbi:TRAP transporter TatT component family protein [Modicisalibacter radicis]|uniref:TRAP transporter TatT component family protein n=1 Tax=Halomonas sp. EAR18 TaxID=2518972 RepID=UPI00109BFC85|nr:TRAP transporter TatT component family protein [Halomonas sp. EAR18]